MKKLRWATDEGGFWEIDMSTPATLDGLARPVPGNPLPLGLSRGARLSRPKQIDFLQRFMSMPFIPSFAPVHHGFALQRLFSLPFGDRWFATLLGQFNIHKLVSSLKNGGLMHPAESSWFQSFRRLLSDKSMYALSFCSELLLTPDDMLLLSFEAYGDQRSPRRKAILHHKFPHHNLTVEAAWPGLSVDQHGSYWDVPFTLALDLASVSSDSGTSCHVCINHNMGSPIPYDDQITEGIPATLLPCLCAKCAVLFRKNIDLWRSEAPKLKLVQPYDMFLSNPHVSAAGALGAVVTASLGANSSGMYEENRQPSLNGLRIHAAQANSAILADLFASVSLSAQYGYFQRTFLDLTRLHARLDFPSGSKLLAAAISAAYDLSKSQAPTHEVIQAICPCTTFSIQQQIAGPFSFRVDSGVKLELKKRGWHASVRDPVFAVEYALQVLGSAKAVAWYSPKKMEFMVELRFFEP